jgi:hypothetical protein
MRMVADGLAAIWSEPRAGSVDDDMVMKMMLMTTMNKIGPLEGVTHRWT